MSNKKVEVFGDKKDFFTKFDYLGFGYNNDDGTSLRTIGCEEPKELEPYLKKIQEIWTGMCFGWVARTMDDNSFISCFDIVWEGEREVEHEEVAGEEFTISLNGDYVFFTEEPSSELLHSSRDKVKRELAILSLDFREQVTMFLELGRTNYADSTEEGLENE